MVASDSDKPNYTYDTVLFFWRVVVNIFFREIRPRGAFHIPTDGPVIFVAAPHHNQFLDPVLVASEAFREAHRRPAFLTAAKSMKRKVVGAFARLMSSIPVARAADDAKPGTGRIAISPDDPCLVIGYGTKFTTEIQLKKQLMLSKGLGFPMAEVSEIISDTELRVKKEFGGESGKGTSKIREQLQTAKENKNIDGLDYKILPYVDQSEMYRHVYSRLMEGGSIAIFPEGGSHDRTDLLPLKAGVSIMALGAMAADPNLRVHIVPVGLSYFHAHRFRSRAVVEFGEPIDVPRELVDEFNQGGSNKRAATSKLLDLIFDGLKTVTVRAPDYETLMLIQAGRRLYKTPGQHLTLGQVVELNKRFIEGYMHFQHEPRIQALKAEVLKYNRELRDLGLKDHQVPRAKRAAWKNLGLLTYRVGLLAVWSTFALPGVILNGPIFLIASYISRQKQKEALAASTVKIAARDVLATWKVLISLGVAPFVYGFYALIATIVVIRSGAPVKWRLWTPFAVMVALPLIGFSALKFGEAGMDVLKSIRPLFFSLLPGHQKMLDRLKAKRERLSNELSEIINEFGPKLYEDFDEWRILVPSSTAPPSTGTPGIWRRRTAAGGVDAQGNLLVHPMSWLDERLFGWSRSAKRGTSAWAGNHDASGRQTPEASDDEEYEHGDYDDVLGHLSGYQKSSGKRSLHGSYADLQQLKKIETAKAGRQPLPRSPLVNQYTPLHPASPITPGSARRERKGSLTDGVNVGRLAALDPVEPFKEATEDINREVEERKRRGSVGS